MTQLRTDVIEKRGTYPEAVSSRAIFDPAGKYRYLLVREFAHTGPAIHFCMLNPATADESKDDPTIKRCVVRARMLGYSSVYISNIFGLRSADPGKLKTDPDPIGPANDQFIEVAYRTTNRTVVAWGSFGFTDRAEQVLGNLPGTIWCLGKTKDGYPRHPLYIPYSEPLKEYAKRWHPVSDKSMLREIAGDPFFDDANLSASQIQITRRLYRQGLINAIPVEGSDAQVDALRITPKGKDYLRSTK